MQALSEPDRLEDAQRVVSSSAPALQRIFDQALQSAEWYGSARRAEVVRAAGVADADDRMDAVEEDLQRRFPGTEIFLHLDPEGHTDREGLLPHELTETR